MNKIYNILIIIILLLTSSCSSFSLFNNRDDSKSQTIMVFLNNSNFMEFESHGKDSGYMNYIISQDKETITCYYDSNRKAFILDINIDEEKFIQDEISNSLFTNK